MMTRKKRLCVRILESICELPLTARADAAGTMRLQIGDVARAMPGMHQQNDTGRIAHSLRRHNARQP